MKKHCKNQQDKRHTEKSDLHSEWLLNVATHLAKKVNPNIQVSKKGNILQIGNISESDLPKLSFVASKDTSNKVSKLVNFGVSIPDSNGNPLSLNIPGLSAFASKIFADSNADAFLSGKKLFRPFASHSSDSATTNNISEYIDTLTNMNPSLPKSSGKPKTFNLAIHNDYSQYGGSCFNITNPGQQVSCQNYQYKPQIYVRHQNQSSTTCTQFGDGYQIPCPTTPAS